MNDSTSPKKRNIKRVPTKKRLKKWLLSFVAVLFTLAPLFTLSLWIKNAYFSDPRHTVALEQMVRPENPPQLFEEPIVSVTFDDGWESIYSQAAPILEKHGVRTTQYILSGQFDKPNYLSEKQVLSLQKAGHDIQSHTVTHADLKLESNESLEKELTESKEALSKLTKAEITDFASPLNSYDERTLETIRKYYRSHRTTEADISFRDDYNFNLPTNFDRWKITAFSVRRTTTTEDITQFLQDAKKKNAWAVLVYHEVDEKSTSYYAVTPSSFDSQMRAVANSGLRIATMDEVMDFYEATIMTTVLRPDEKQR